jgi:hypothetical protein
MEEFVASPFPRPLDHSGTLCKYSSMTFSRDRAHRLLFIEVPESKQVKNRIHFEVRPVEGKRDAELARLIELGAVTIDDRRNADGTGWVVLADPEGRPSTSRRAEEAFRL